MEAILEQATLAMRENRPRDVITILSDGLAMSKQNWNTNHAAAIIMLAEHCITESMIDTLKKGFKSYLKKVQFKETALFATVIQHAQKFAADRIAEVERKSQQDGEETIESRIVFEMTGVSGRATTRQRIIDRAVIVFREVTKVCMDLCQSNGKYEVVHQRAARFAFTVFEQFKRRNEFYSVSDWVTKHVRIIEAKLTERNLDESHPNRKRAEEFIKDLKTGEVVQATLKTLTQRLTVATTLCQWPVVLDCVSDLRKLTRFFRTCDVGPKIADLVEYFSALAAAFAAAGNTTFHAHALRQQVVNAARLVDATPASVVALASRTVLAVLCVPEDEADSMDLAHDQDREKLQDIARNFGMNTAPTRGSLVQELYKPTAVQGKSLLELASPEARLVFQELQERAQMNVCQNIASALAGMADGPLEQYLEPIRQSAVRAMVRALSKCFSNVSLDYLMSLCPFYAPDEFTSKVEPVILDLTNDPSNSVSLALDMMKREIWFTPVWGVGDQVVGIQGFAAREISDAALPCFPKPAAAPATPAAALLALIERERDRVLTRNVVCALRITKAQERDAKAVDDSQKKREQDEKARIEMEQARLEKSRQREIARLRKEVEEEAARQRRRWIITAANQRHKTLRLPESLANHPQEKFVQLFTQALVVFRREQELARESDVKQMDHYERFCREVEAPIRRAHDEVTATQNRQEREIRRANLIQKHRTDYETAVADKKRLARFMTQKASYERELAEQMKSQLGEKTKRRDEQEASLEAFRRERELAAGGSAAPAAAAAARREPEREPEEEPVRPAPTGPVEPLPSSGSRWVPKSLRK